MLLHLINKYSFLLGQPLKLHHFVENFLLSVNRSVTACGKIIQKLITISGRNIHYIIKCIRSHALTHIMNFHPSHSYCTVHAFMSAYSNLLPLWGVISICVCASHAVSQWEVSIVWHLENGESKHTHTDTQSAQCALTHIWPIISRNPPICPLSKQQAPHVFTRARAHTHTPIVT